MTDALKARDSKDVEDAIAWALAESKTLDVVGGGSKRALGRPNQSDMTLDLSGLSGIMLYEPEELVLSARAGTPLSEVEAAVAASGQELAFEPPDYSVVLGTPAGRATIGGVLATNLSGPRRVKAGAARDFFLGATAVSGRGETFKTGGRVVKNVTGYDLCKLLAGSYGTLAAMTDVTIKTLPRAETEETLVLAGLDDEAAAKPLALAMGSSCEVSGAAHLPAHVASRFEAFGAARAATVLRIEGVKPSVVHRRETLRQLLKDVAAIDTLDGTASRVLWRAIRDVQPFAAAAEGHERPLWRVSTAPREGLRLGSRLSPGAQMFHDWAGGLVWVLMPPSDDAGARAIREALAPLGGHATLIRAPSAVRAAVDVFHPQPPGAAALTRRVKDGFDPRGILNPGRMWAGV